MHPAHSLCVLQKVSAPKIRKDDQLCKLTSTNLPIVWLRCENYRVTTCLLYGCIVQANEYQLVYCMTTLCQLPHNNLPIAWLYNANYRVAVGLLEGQGWELKRPTLPSLHTEKPTL